MAAKIDPTWADVNAIVKMRKAGSLFDLNQLEVAFAKSDDAMIKTILNALKGEYEDFEAEVYPFGGIRLTIDIQKKRALKWFEDKTLVSYIYSQSKAKETEKKVEEEVIVPTPTPKPTPVATPAKGPDPKVEEVGKTTSTPTPTPAKPKESKRPRASMDIRDQIKFEKLMRTEAHSAHIPTIDDHYVFPAWTTEFVRMMDNGINVWLHGGTGAGKSSLVEQVCATGGIPLVYQSFHEDVKPDQLFGGMKLVDGNTVWVDGPVTKAYREGLVLLLDEIDALPPEIQFCLYGILDRKPLVLAENDCEVVHPHPSFRAAATGNTKGRGDESGMFGGTNILNRAFLNRFRVWYEVAYPTEATYRKIIENEGVAPAIAAVIARLAQDINSAYMKGTLTETFSLRDARDVSLVANLTEGEDVSRALQLTLLNRLSSVEQAAVNEMFRRIIPKDFN